MNDSLLLQENLHPWITPAGAYYAVSGRDKTPSRELLCSILDMKEPVPLSKELLLGWMNSDDYESVLNVLYRLQKLEFIFGGSEAHVIKEDRLDQRLSELLKELSDTGKALLADESGLYLATAGFHHESSEEIAALAGEVVSLSEQHALLIRNNLNINQNSWAICNPSGRSELAFFPLYFGDYTIILVIAGVPQLQNEYFVELIQALHRRYGK